METYTRTKKPISAASQWSSKCFSPFKERRRKPKSKVNISYSSVHVPTNVYDGEPKVINAIDWSRKLDDTFKDNYQRDPSLSWQFFGSSTGFLRQVRNLFLLHFEDV